MRQVIIKDKAVYKDTLEYLKTAKKDFQIIKSGSTEKIIYNDKAYIYYDSHSKNRGFYLCKMVNDDIEEYIKTHQIKPRFRDYKEQMFNLKAIENNIGTSIISIDINNCYWETLFRLGYVTQKTYMAGLRKKEWKIGRNASIGSLAKKTIIIYYEKGVINGRMRDVLLPEIEKQFIRNHIIGYVYDMFYGLYKKLGREFLMYLTDCVYTTPNNLTLVEKYFQGLGYKTKTQPMQFIQLEKDKKKVFWINPEVPKIVKYYWYNDNQTRW